MPRITNIHIMRRTNLGNYEHFEFSADAAITEEESVAEATAVLQEYVDWHARKPVRDGLRLDHLRIIANPESPEEAKTKSQNWINKYDAMKAKMEAL